VLQHDTIFFVQSFAVRGLRFVTQFNRNRLNWPKIQCNRNRLHCQFHRNRRLLSRLIWKSSTYITAHPTAVLVAEVLPLSSFVIVMFQGRPLVCLCVLNPDNPAAKHMRL